MKAFTLGAAITLVFSAAAYAQAPTWTVPAESQRCPSKWGAADERGSANHQKPAAVMNAAKLIKTADVIAYHSGTAGRSIARSIADSLINETAIEELLIYPVTTGSTDHPLGYYGAVEEF